MKSLLLHLAAARPLLVLRASSSAQTIVDEWTNVKAPPAPVLKDVTVDPKTTALLMLDFVAAHLRRPAALPGLVAGAEEAAGGRAFEAECWWSIR